MKLVIGLGNPGEKYKNNRHNVGHFVIDEIKNKKIKTKGMIFVKTDTFMNDSGVAVKYAVKKHKVKTENLYIIHDDLDLPLGAWKMTLAKGPKDHGGINDIEQKLGTDNFFRIRVGVDNRKHEPHFTKVTRGKEYVLEDFTGDEKVVLAKVINEICKKLATF